MTVEPSTRSETPNGSLIASVVVVVVVELLGWAIFVGIVLVGALALDVVLVIHVLGTLLCMLVGLVLVVLVHAVSLGEFVHLTADKTRKDFLGECMVDHLAWEQSVIDSIWTR